MKKIALIVLAIAVALLATGCITETADDGEVTGSSLIDSGIKKDTFTLSNASSRSAEAFDYAFSDGEPLEDDMFLIYVEAAKIAQELEISSAKAETEASVDQELAQATEEIGDALGSALTSIFDPLASLFGDTGTSTDPGTSGGSTDGQGTDPGSGGTGTTTGAPSDKDSEALTALFNEYKVYDDKAQVIINEYNSDPWSSRDILISDDSLVNLFVASQDVFDFIKDHPDAKDGDMVLSTIGDTMVTIYEIWGLGKFEAQTAFLMINIYYPNGSYVTHAEQQLLLL